MSSSLRFALRSLHRTPGFTVLAIAILTLGIGATTAMFSITDTVLFKPLAYRDPGRLASLSLTIPAFANLADRIPLNGSHYRFFQQHSRTLAGIALIGPSNFVLSGAGQAVAVRGVRVTPNFFSLLGVQPRVGRDFLPQEGNVGKDQVVILSSGLWHAKFNADPHILGRKITLDGTPYRVVGVMAPDFPFPRGRQLSDVELLPEHTQYWIPLSLSPEDFARADGNMRYLSIVRLKPNVSFPESYADLRALESVISKQFSQPIEIHPVLQPLRASLVEKVRQPLLLLLGAVVLYSRA